MNLAEPATALLGCLSGLMRFTAMKQPPQPSPSSACLQLLLFPGSTPGWAASSSKVSSCRHNSYPCSNLHSIVNMTCSTRGLKVL